MCINYGEERDLRNEYNREENTLESFKKRERLLRHPEVKRILKRWFYGISGGEDAIRKGEYIELGMLMMHELIPDEAEDEIREVLKEDWNIDSHGDGDIDLKAHSHYTQPLFIITLTPTQNIIITGV